MQITTVWFMRNKGKVYGIYATLLMNHFYGCVWEKDLLNDILMQSALQWVHQ